MRISRLFILFCFFCFTPYVGANNKYIDFTAIVEQSSRAVVNISSIQKISNNKKLDKISPNVCFFELLLQVYYEQQQMLY